MGLGITKVLMLTRNEPMMSKNIAFVFPGQGSQSVGMVSEFAEQFPQIQATFEEASQVLGIDLWRVVQFGPAQTLDQTHITQPAILSASVALWRVWQAMDLPMPAMMAGHSLGEYSALVCAQALSFADAVALVAQRGRIMQDAVPSGTGAMAAVIGLDDDTILQVCSDAAQGQVVAPVNYNSPGQVVIAGQCEAVTRAIALAKLAKARKVIPLNVSVPSHCALMESAASQFAPYLAQVAFTAPVIPILHNVDVHHHFASAEIQSVLEQQLFNPVRWTETIVAMANEGISQIIECGPGKVLTGLTKRIDKKLMGLSMQAAIAQFEPAAQVMEG